MNDPVQSKQNVPRLLAASIPAALLWFCTFAFTIRWLYAWGIGRLEPGDNTSGLMLFIIFAVALLASIGGMYISVSAWRGRSTRRWQVGSLLGAVVVLWAVCGG